MNSTKRYMRRTLKILRISLILLVIVNITSCMSEEKSKRDTTMEKNQSQSITLINPFEVPEGKLKESIVYWEACRDFLKKEPGYISTKLHQSIKDGSKFMLINVAVWESPKAFTEASQKMAKELGVPPTEGLKANPSLYKVISE